MTNTGGLRFILFTLLLPCGPMVLLAQRAQITGRVTDSSGAVIVGTDVSARNADTGLRWEAVANEVGYYTIALLPPGRYEVLVRKEGFRTISRSGIKLETDQVLRLDFEMHPGQVSERIDVVGEVPQVQTQQSSLGAVVERRRIENLPLNGRHVFNLVKLVAGVQPRDRGADGFGEISNQGFSEIHFNGGPIAANQFFLDGGSNTAPVHNEIAVVPMVDAVEEFKVETNALKAEFGQTSGGIVNVVTKSGTNDPHGSLYEFIRNDAMDARNAFATQVSPSTGRIKAVLRYNQYGGTFGGPVYIPKVYNGKNRTFFFAGYEQWRYRNAQIRRASVPSALQRAGDFSNTRGSTGAVIPIFDPATTRAHPNGNGFIRDPFPGNIVPGERIDPLSRKVLEYMPLPNATPASTYTNENNFYSQAIQPSNQGVTNIRVDHRFSDADSAFFRYSGTRNTRWGTGYGLGPADPDIFSRHDQRDNHNWTLTETHVFSPNLINEFKGNVARQYLPAVHPSYGGSWPQKLGYPSIIPQDVFPTVAIEGMLTLGASGFGVASRMQHSVQVADSVTWIKGKHALKVGIDQRWVRLNFELKTYPSGNYTFGAGLTGNPQARAGSGYGLATYLLGQVSGGVLNISSPMAFHDWSHASYVQDDYKITRRLTLNVGLRYDLRSSPVERWNRHSNFDPYAINSETNMPGVLTYAGVTAPRGFVDRNYGDFGPRVGFAYALTGDGKTAIRGGYGLIYLLSESYDTQGDASNSLGWAASTSFTPSSSNYATFRFSEGPATLVLPMMASGGPSAYRGQAVRAQNRHAPSMYLQQFNLTLQREIPGQWVLTASYAGNHGVHLPGSNYDLNQLDPKYYLQYGLSLQNLAANPYYGQIKSGSLSGATVARSQLLLPYPDYTTVYTMANHGNNSIYHSLQLTAEKRYAKGLSMLASYTNGKVIDESWSCAGGSCGATGDFRVGRLNRRQDRSIDADDISQRLVVSGVYELPIGRGKALFGNARGITDYVVGGWQIDSIVTTQTGTPLTVRGANNNALNWPNVTTNPTLHGENRGVQKWFDTGAFQNPPDFTVGNIARTLPDTRGPGMFQMDFSVLKNLHIKERTRLEFRAEAFNVLNHVNLNNPGTTFSPSSAGVNISATFGRIAGSMNSRTIQLGLRMTF